MRLIETGAALILLLLAPFPALAERFRTSAGEVEVSQMANGLKVPWSLAFLPDGDWLVSERGGRLLLITEGAARPVTGVANLPFRQ